MPIGYAHDFRNALHKAMGWISPGTENEYVELPEIGYDPPDFKARQNHGQGYRIICGAKLKKMKLNSSE
jgi:hypothetical protein